MTDLFPPRQDLCLTLQPLAWKVWGGVNDPGTNIAGEVQLNVLKRALQAPAAGDDQANVLHCAKPRFEQVAVSEVTCQTLDSTPSKSRNRRGACTSSEVNMDLAWWV